MNRIIKICALCAVLLASITTFAQTSRMAVLNHQGTITTFYGDNALVEAVAVADHGDIITLSGGSFTSTNITKAITIRGAGIDNGGDTKRVPTKLIGHVYITYDGTATDPDAKTVIESIYTNYNIWVNATIKAKTEFIKCRLNALGTNSGKNQIVNIMQSRVFGTVGAGGDYNVVTCYSSYLANASIANASGTNNDKSAMELNNCILSLESVGTTLSNVALNNSILLANKSDRPMGTKNKAFNCIIAGPYANNFTTLRANDNQSNWFITDWSMFKFFNGESYGDNTKFDLTDEANSTYIGTDGTPVGWFGGSIPYNVNPIVPTITKFDVSPKSTTDGHINVDITVAAPE